MYTCGPTVYGPGHIGHARSYTNFDLLKRAFLYNGFKVKHILNITDIHDDMIKKAAELKISVVELADRYIPLFKKDFEELNIIPADFYPRVTEHIPKIIKMIEVLVEKGYGYIEKDGSVYFDVSKFVDYGKLSGIKPEEGKTGTRVETDKYEREEATDFALWKASKKGEPFWNSPWGKGRPGWHIECSVMASEYLGKTIDLHAGAMDLKFPHHENEIAQSEAANGVKFVNFWFHGGLLEVENKKMSKSLGNILTLEDVKNRGFDPLALRYLFLTCHYRSKMNFTWKGLEGAQAAYQKLLEMVKSWRKGGRQVISETDVEKIDGFRKKFQKKINDDLNIPEALAITWEVAKSNIPDPDKLDLILDFDKVLGLELVKGLPEEKVLPVPREVEDLANKREALRRKKKWDEADKIRKEIENLGFVIEDTVNGPRIKSRFN